MVENQLHEIREKIVRKASFIFEKIFDEDQVPGVSDFLIALKAFLDKEAYNSFTSRVVSRRYREFIDELISIGKLNAFIKNYLAEENEDLSRYGELGLEIQSDLKEYQEEILSLTDLLRTLEKGLNEQKPINSSLEEFSSLPQPLPSDDKLSAPQVIGGVISALGVAVIGLGIKVLKDKLSGSGNKGSQKT